MSFSKETNEEPFQVLQVQIDVQIKTNPLLNRSSKQLLKIYKKQCKSLGPLHEDTLTTRLNLSQALLDKDQKPDEALRHLEPIIDHVPAILGPLHYKSILALKLRARLHRAQGEPEECKNLLLRVVQNGATQRILNLSLDDVCKGLIYFEAGIDLGICFFEEKRHDRALESYIYSFEIISNLMGIHGDRTWKLLGNVCQLFADTNNFRLAVSLCKLILKSQEKYLPAEHEDRVHSEHTLEYMTQSLKIQESIGPDSAFQVTTKETEAKMWNSLALILFKFGEYKEAEECFQKSLTILQEKYRREPGSVEVEIMMTRQMLSLVQEKLGCIESGYVDLQLILRRWTEKYGTENEEYIILKSNMALLACRHGNYHEAFRTNRKVLREARKLLNKSDPIILTIKHNQVCILITTGEYSEAFKLCLKVVEDRTRVLGPDHEDTSNSSCVLASLYSSQRRDAIALDMLENVAKMRRSKLGEDHPMTLVTEHDYMIVKANVGFLDEALEYCSYILTKQVEALGSIHPETARTCHTLGVLYKNKGLWAKSCACLDDALKARTNIYGPEHPETIMILLDLANLFELQRNFRDALELYKEGYEILKKGLGEQHPRVQACAQHVYGASMMLVRERKAAIVNLR